MTGALLSLLRWVIYITLIIAIPAVLQVIALSVSYFGPWWFWLLIYPMFGWTLTLVIVYGIASICPLPKYPNLLYIGFYIVAECSYLYFRGAGSNGLEIFLRLGTDFIIVIGVLAGAISPFRYKEHTKNT